MYVAPPYPIAMHNDKRLDPSVKPFSLQIASDIVFSRNQVILFQQRKNVEGGTIDLCQVDALDADSIVQYALFGEIVFG